MFELFILQVQVVEITLSNPAEKPRFAIQLKDGSFYGQKMNNDGRTYPTWKTQRGAEKRMIQLVHLGLIKNADT